MRGWRQPICCMCHHRFLLCGQVFGLGSWGLGLGVLFVCRRGRGGQVVGFGSWWCVVVLRPTRFVHVCSRLVCSIFRCFVWFGGMELVLGLCSCWLLCRRFCVSKMCVFGWVVGFGFLLTVLKVSLF